MRRRGLGRFGGWVAGVTTLAVEPLERRLLAAGDLRFAVIGDYSAGQPERDVSDLVKGWNPAFVVTVGDNNYPDGAAATIDANVGQYYHQYISPYKGTYGPGAADGVNHFFPALGNHDWNTANAQPYLDYFTLPNNERYYDFTRGNVEFFVVDSDPHEPDGVSSTSIQANWLRTELAASTAQWKLVVFHHPAYSSGGIGSNAWMQWPFKAWGATAVLAGHDHDYERLIEGGLPYFVDGLGGEDIQGFATPVAGSQVRYAGDFGAMLIDATDSAIAFQFVTRTGAVIDTYTVGTATLPAAPSGLVATPVSMSQIKLAWTDNAVGETGFKVERSADNVNFATIATTASGVTSYTDSSLTQGTQYSYRVRATNAAGDSAYSNIAGASTLSGPATTYLSDLAWTSATNGWGPVEKDLSNGGQAAGDGQTITLNGVTYAKGLGVHAPSQVVYNLGGNYANFLADVGVDDEEATGGSVVFQVQADGKTIYDSGVMYYNSATKSFNLNVGGVNTLTLIVNDAGDGNNFDHADWAGARLTAPQTPTPPTAPTGLTAVSVAANQVNLAWSDNATTESGYKIERSADGVTFALIATTAANVTTFSDTTVSTTVTNYYRVRATNAAGDSASSNVATSDPLTPPAAPSGLGATAISSTQVRLAWTDNSTNESGFKVERSTDGTNFAVLASTDANTTAYTDATTSPGTKYYYRVLATNPAGNSAYANVASVTTPMTLPAPWADGDVGTVGIAGSASASGGVFTVKGSGADVWGTADSFHYVYQTLNGDGQIIARVTALQNTNSNAKAGVMIREGLGANAREVSAVVTPGNGVVFLQRANPGGSTSATFATGNVATPYWVKLVRAGSTFSAYRSTDGATWKLMGSATINMATSVDVGLVVCAKNNAALNTSTFDNVALAGSGVAAASTSPGVGSMATITTSPFDMAPAPDVTVTPPDQTVAGPRSKKAPAILIN